VPLWDQFLSIRKLMSRNIFILTLLFRNSDNVIFVAFILAAIPNSANYSFVSQPSIVLTLLALILFLYKENKTVFFLNQS